MELILATNNLHKIREYREMLKVLKNVDILTLKNFPDYSLPKETGISFLENAEIKAVDAAKSLGKIVLADDSGLVVPAIKGKPGVYSSRYAGEEATDAENRAKLLAEMEHLEELDRSAYFECCIVVADLNGKLKTAEAKCEGLITTKEKGRNGFGYDPLFVKYDYDKTFAELDELTKNRISHRRKALDKLLPFLESILLTKTSIPT